jgi:UrcA family protein
MNRPTTIACAGVLALSATAGAADDTPIRIVQQRVPYGDLDLSSRAGARAMIGRIHIAAARLCAQPLMPLLPRVAAEVYRCRLSVMTRSVAKLNAPAVTREYAHLSPEVPALASLR